MRVTNEYESTYTEIATIIEIKRANKDIGSLYTFMFESKNAKTIELGKRLLLE